MAYSLRLNNKGQPQATRGPPSDYPTTKTILKPPENYAPPLHNPIIRSNNIHKLFTYLQN